MTRKLPPEIEREIKAYRNKVRVKGGPRWLAYLSLEREVRFGGEQIATEQTWIQGQGSSRAKAIAHLRETYIKHLMEEVL